jgi:hypothetical protein
MLKWLSKVFPSAKIKVLEEQITELKEKLIERQEAINKTNAYWKKKFREVNSKTDKNL